MTYSHAAEIATSQRYGPNTAALRLAEGWCPIAAHPKLVTPDRLHGTADTYCTACNVEWIIDALDTFDGSEPARIVVCQAVQFVTSECVTVYARSILTWAMLTDAGLTVIDDVLRSTVHAQHRRIAKSVIKRATQFDDDHD